MCQTLETPDQREHVTRAMYEQPDRYTIYNFSAPEPLHHLDLAIDTPADMFVFEKMLHQMTKPHWAYSLEETLTLFQSTSK